MMKKAGKALRYIVISLIIAVIGGVVLMIGTYAIPTARMYDNVLKSLPIYETETEGYYWASGNISSYLDNYTDTLMLNTALCKGDGTVVENAMNTAHMCYLDNAAKVESLSRLVQNQNTDLERLGHYARYWHGYLIWLKPLLLFLSVADIRILAMCFQSILLLLVLLELFKITGTKGCIAMLLTVWCINPISTAMCMQYASIYVITLVGALILLKKKIYDSENYWKLFLWIGIATAFFDLLTYPLVGLGINLLLVLYLGKNTFRESIRKICNGSLSWGIGYACMWAGK